jgi:hypothetical protein
VASSLEVFQPKFCIHFFHHKGTHCIHFPLLYYFNSFTSSALHHMYWICVLPWRERNRNGDEVPRPWKKK